MGLFINFMLDLQKSNYGIMPPPQKPLSFSISVYPERSARQLVQCLSSLQATVTKCDVHKAQLKGD